MTLGRAIRMGLGVLLLVWSGLAATAEPSPAMTRIRVGIDLWPGYYPVVIGSKLGLFKQRGLDVQYFVPENTEKMLGDFAEGKVDIVCIALGDAITLKTRASSLKVAMISDESAGGDALLSLKPLPASLKGLRIGTNLNGFGELLVREFLKQHNTPMAEVSLVQQDAAQAGDYLATGKVDIAHTWEPYVSEAAYYHQAQVVFSSAQTPGLIPDAVVFNGQLLANPEAARAFIAVWLEAAEWWLHNRQAGNEIAEGELLQMPNTVKLDGIRLFDAAANRAAFARGETMQSLYVAANKYLDYFKAKDAVPATLMAEDILEPNLLPSSPEAMQD